MCANLETNFQNESYEARYKTKIGRDNNVGVKYWWIEDQKRIIRRNRREKTEDKSAKRQRGKKKMDVSSGGSDWEKD